MTQEIIVYRNPGEKALWDALMTPEFFIFFVAGVAMVVAMVISSSFLDRQAARVLGWRNAGYFHFGVGALVGGLVGWFMWV